MPTASHSIPTWLPETHREYRDVVRKFAVDDLVPLAAQIDRTGEFPSAAVEQMERLGLFTLAIPESHGGMDSDLVTQCLAAEELAYGTPAAALTVSPTWVASLILRYAGGENADRWLGKLTEPGHLCGVALSEPNAGSDSAALTLAATPTEGGYLLNGRKCWITNAGVADIFCVFARTSKGERGRGITAFMVERGTPGFSVPKLEDKMGLRGSTTGELLFEDAFVSAENVVGEVGQGFRYVMQAFDQTRPLIGIMALGVARAALDTALLYARERRQFDQPISDFQGLQFLLADMAIDLESARALAYEAARLADERSPHTTLFASMSKSFATDAAMRITTDAVQVLGGYGYVKDFPVERMMRDVKIFQIFEGTNQIQRMLVARHLNKWADEELTRRR